MLILAYFCLFDSYSILILACRSLIRPLAGTCFAMLHSASFRFVGVRSASFDARLCSRVFVALRTGSYCLAGVRSGSCCPDGKLILRRALGRAYEHIRIHDVQVAVR
ncbi:hypothetical protein [Ferrovibrio sp.]|uniref:hypothetical protein n=1 Tax=Ferrovibrio sp. TaxID=1917215 RepID=UPI0025BA7B2B|nr:hypothetical protein [Ferrovibrio sp.]